MVLALSAQIAQKVSVKGAQASGFTDAAGHTLSQVASVVSAVPYVGQVVSTFINVLANMDAGQNAQSQQICQEHLQNEATALNQFTSLGIPFPLTISEDIPSMFSCTPVNPNGTKAGSTDVLNPGQTSAYLWPDSPAADVLNTLFAQWQTAIPDSLMVPVLQWWAIVLLTLSDPRMTAAFSTLGRGIPQGEGGHGSATYVASDEQVYLVALPLALIYNLDLPGFANVLWNASNGWRDGQANGLFMGNGYSTDISAGGGPQQFATYCVGAPLNAYIVNFTILCRDAWPLAQQVAVSRKAALAAQAAGQQTSIQKTVAAFVAAGAKTLHHRARFPKADRTMSLYALGPMFTHAVSLLASAMSPSRSLPASIAAATGPSPFLQGMQAGRADRAGGRPFNVALFGGNTSADFLRGYASGYGVSVVNFRAGFSQGVSDAQNGRPFASSPISNDYTLGYRQGYLSINPAPAATPPTAKIIEGMGPADAFDVGWNLARSVTDEYGRAKREGRNLNPNQFGSSDASMNDAYTLYGIPVYSSLPAFRDPMAHLAFLQGYFNGWSLSYFEEHPLACKDAATVTLHGNFYRRGGNSASFVIPTPNYC